jgi:hypothetical protein
LDAICHVVPTFDYEGLLLPWLAFGEYNVSCRPTSTVLDRY